MASKFKCPKCGTFTSTASNLSRHIRRTHDLAVLNNGFQCLECDRNFERNSSLITHLQSSHDKKFEFEHSFMKDMSEFFAWRKKIQEEFKVRYVHRGSVKEKGVMYLNCYRSNDGSGRSKFSIYKRQLKKQGSCKSAVKCTSQIKVILHGTNVEVIWCRTHYGHPEEDKPDEMDESSESVDHSHLDGYLLDIEVPYDSSSDKMDTETPIRASEVSEDVQVSQEKDSCLFPNEDAGRKVVGHPFSVDLFVQEDPTDSDERKILFYKKQGVPFKGLKDEDFCLIIMTSSQAVMAKKYGSSLIAVDGTHDLNFYDFELTTLMIADELFGGFPIAFMFSSRINKPILSFFIKAVKRRVGVISTKTFMTDLCETVYDAWASVMGNPSHILYSPWHVERAWQQNLYSVTPNVKRKEIYQVLKRLQRHTKADVFEENLHNFITFLYNDEATTTFAQYFEKQFSHNYSKWAHCFRFESAIISNIHLESIHKEIKYFNKDKESVKRLNQGLVAVMKFVTDKTLDAVLKITKGVRGPRGIFLMHNQALKSRSKYYFEKISKRSYKLTMLADMKEYFVNKVTDICCKRICQACNICCHSYTCTCDDFRLLSVRSICTHVHLVAIHIHKRKEKQVGKIRNSDDAIKCVVGNEVVGMVVDRIVTDNNESGIEWISENIRYCRSGNAANRSRQNHNNDEDSLRSQIQKTLATLPHDNLSKLNAGALNGILEHLTAVGNLLNSSVENRSESVCDNVANVETNEDRSHSESVNSSTKNVQQNKNMDELLSALVCTPLLHVSSSASNDHSYL